MKRILIILILFFPIIVNALDFPETYSDSLIIYDLTDDNIKLKQEIRRLQEVASSNSEVPSRSANNVDLLKRISQLEKVVYGNNE